MKVFISYAREDIDSASRLFSELGSIPGIEPWFDAESILPGTDWNAEIERSIATSQLIVILLSARSVNKEGYVQKEVRLALDLLSYRPPGQIFIIPARLDPSNPLHPELRKLHFCDLFPNWESGVKQILKAVESRKRSVDEFRDNVRPLADGLPFDKGVKIGSGKSTLINALTQHWANISGVWKESYQLPSTNQEMGVVTIRQRFGKVKGTVRYQGDRNWILHGEMHGPFLIAQYYSEKKNLLPGSYTLQLQSNNILLVGIYTVGRPDVETISTGLVVWKKEA